MPDIEKAMTGLSGSHRIMSLTQLTTSNSTVEGQSLPRLLTALIRCVVQSPSLGCRGWTAECSFLVEWSVPPCRYSFYSSELAPYRRHVPIPIQICCMQAVRLEVVMRSQSVWTLWKMVAS
jgi:hypothetical protein